MRVRPTPSSVEPAVPLKPGNAGSRREGITVVRPARVGDRHRRRGLADRERRRIAGAAVVLAAGESRPRPCKCPRWSVHRQWRTTGRGAGIVGESQADPFQRRTGVPLNPVTLSVAGNGLPLYVPPASVTVTVGVAWPIVNVVDLLAAAIVLAARECGDDGVSACGCSVRPTAECPSLCCRRSR